MKDAKLSTPPSTGFSGKVKRSKISSNYRSGFKLNFFSSSFYSMLVSVNSTTCNSLQVDTMLNVEFEHLDFVYKNMKITFPYPSVHIPTPSVVAHTGVRTSGDTVPTTWSDLSLTVVTKTYKEYKYDYDILACNAIKIGVCKFLRHSVFRPGIKYPAFKKTCKEGTLVVI